MTEFRRPTPLDTDRHERGRFDSGEPVLDDWLRRYAGQNRRRDTSATWVMLDRENTVVAYISLAMTGVDHSAAPSTLSRRSPDPVPALLLGRLAVDRSHQGLSVGTALVAHALSTAVELNTKAACRAVIVSASNPGARRWWTYLGFHPFSLDNEEDPDLYLLTAEIQKTLENLR